MIHVKAKSFTYILFWMLLVLLTFQPILQLLGFPFVIVLVPSPSSLFLPLFYRWRRLMSYVLVFLLINQYYSAKKKKKKKSCTPYALKNGQITFLQRLMWVFFGLKYVKLSTFYILHIFATTDVVALSITIYKFHSLLLKKKKN